MRKSVARSLPSPAMVVALTALFVALGGTGYAATQLSQSPSAAAAKHKKKNDNAQDKKLFNKLIKKAAPTLSVASATNASDLGGIPASGYTQKACGPLTGQIKGFARINDASVSTTGLSTAGVEVPYNCSGGTVLARRFTTGKYEVVFSNSPVVLALATPLEATGATGWSVNSASVNRVGTGDFYVQIWNDPTSAFTNGSFTILTP